MSSSLFGIGSRTIRYLYIFRELKPYMDLSRHELWASETTDFIELLPSSSAGVPGRDETSLYRTRSFDSANFLRFWRYPSDLLRHSAIILGQSTT